MPVPTRRWRVPRPLAVALAVLLAVLAGMYAAASDRPTVAGALPRAAPAAAGPSGTAGTATAPPSPTGPPPGAAFDYQLGGPYPPAGAARLVVRDRNDTPARGRYNVCYVNAFQTQAAESRWWQTHHRDLLLTDRAGYVEDPGWPGEILLDASTDQKRHAITSILDRWFAGCAAKGFHAVDPDNLDSWTRSRGLLTRSNNIALARLIVADAHARGLAIGQKNAAGLAGVGRRDVGFDFAIAEECQVYDECGAYLAAYGARVYEIEYTDNSVSYFRQACADHGRAISIILRDRDLVPAGSPGYHYERC